MNIESRCMERKEEKLASQAEEACVEAGEAKVFHGKNFRPEGHGRAVPLTQHGEECTHGIQDGQL